MTTTSANVGMGSGSTMIFLPFKKEIKTQFAGKLYHVSELRKKRSRVIKEGVIDILCENGFVLFESLKEKKYIVNGKRGVWRTINGRHYFFPDDNSGSIPPLKFKEK